MKFKAEPNHYVRCVSQSVKRAIGKKGFYFDENGIFETENPTLINVLKQNFPIVEETEKEIKEEPLRACKKCSFTCDSQGALLQHYKKSHPKGVK